MEEKKKVVIDMDGSLVNLDGTLLTRVSEVLNFDFTKVDGKAYSYEDTIVKYINITKQEVRNVMRSIWNQDGFWRSLPPYDGAIEVVNELAKYCTILACTRIPAESPNAFIEKEGWILDHFPNIEVEFFAVSNGAKKTRVKCDYIIEDRLKEIKSCPSDTVAIILNRPWNTKESSEWNEELRFIRVDSWKDVLEIILKK